MVSWTEGEIVADLICVKSLHDKCNCLNCRDVKDHKDALDFYKQDICKDAAQCEDFPEKENKKE